MITTLTGSNSFGLQQELRRLVSGFVKEHGDLALERLDGEEASIERISEALTSLPFLASKKMVLLREPGKQKQFIERAEQLLGELPETTDVIIVEPKPDKRSVYYKFLKKGTQFQGFPELDANGLTRWLTQTAKERGGELSLPDARYLVDRVGANQQLLTNELDKLLLYAPKVTKQSINELTEATPQSKIFDLLDAAFSGNYRRTLQLYAEQRAQKVEPQIIISMLTWQLHQIALVKTAGDRRVDQIAAETRFSPYSLQKSAVIAKRVAVSQLKALIANLQAIDTRSKRQSLDLDEALQHYLLTVTA